MGNVYMEASQINYRGGSKKMSVEEAIKAAGTEITPEEKTWIDSIPTLTTGKADNDVIAPEFDSEAGVYAIGDLVMYEGKLYEFTTAHETVGEWDPTEVSEKVVSDEIDTLMSGLMGKLNIISSGIIMDGGHKDIDLESTALYLVIAAKYDSPSVYVVFTSGTGAFPLVLHSGSVTVTADGFKITITPTTASCRYSVLQLEND